MSETASSQCRWGFMSTARIGRKNWQAIQKSGNGIIVAVASRNRSSADAYIDECQASAPFADRPAAVAGYDELLAHDNIDAVYIPLPTGVRKKWVIEAARAGKHVVCEKPCAINSHDLSEMIAACRDNHVQFMDGVMFMHTRRLEKMKQALGDAENFGSVRRIASHFSFLGGDEFVSNNIRTNSELEPLGCLGDLGWYTIRIALWALNFRLPTHVIGHTLTGHGPSDSQVPLEFSGELFFDDGISASLYCSFIAQQQQWVHITGTQGELHQPDFVQPFTGDQLKFEVSKNVSTVAGCNFSTELSSRKYLSSEHSDSATDSQETELFRKFAEIVNSGHLESYWPEIALKTQQVVDAVFQSANNGGRMVDLETD